MKVSDMLMKFAPTRKNSIYDTLAFEWNQEILQVMRAKRVKLTARQRAYLRWNMG